MLANPKEHLKNIFRKSSVFRDTRKLLGDIIGVDGQCFAVAILCLKADFFEQLFHYRLQPTRADIFDGRVHVVVYTERDDITRIISLRRANPREVSKYDELRPD